MADEQNPHAGGEKRRDEDTEAILSRRRFLIQSALAGAGIGAAVSGCDRQGSQPQVCLRPPEPMPKPCLEVEPPPDKQPPEPKPPEPDGTKQKPPESKQPKPDGTKQEPPGPGPEICLSIIEPEPKVCLEVMPPEPPPQPCLSPPPPPPVDPKSVPQPCLSVPPRPGPCLSIRAVDPPPTPPK